MYKDKNDQTPEITGGPTDRRSLNVMLGTGFLNQVDQTRRARTERGYVTGQKKQWLPLPLRILSAIGGLFLLFGVMETILLFIAVDGAPLGSTLYVGIGLGVGIPVWGGLRLLEAYLERRDWVRRMREADEEKRNQ